MNSTTKRQRYLSNQAHVCHVGMPDYPYMYALLFLRVIFILKSY